MKTMNEGYTLSSWMDCYRLLAITALFLDEWLAFTPLYLTPPPNFSSPTCFPLGTFSIRQFNAWSGFLQPWHHNWVTDLSHSWVWSYCDSFLATPILSSFHLLSCLPPLHLPKHSIALSTNVLPLICPSFQSRFKCLLLPQGSSTFLPTSTIQKLVSCSRDLIIICNPSAPIIACAV